MANDLESASFHNNEAPEAESPRWLKVGLVAAASALAGGVAAAWWYRKTLTKLRQGDENLPNPDFRISTDDSAEEG